MRFVQAAVMLLGGVGYAALILWSFFTGNTADALAQANHGFVTTESSNLEDSVALVVLWTFIAWNVALLVVTVLVIVDGVKMARSHETMKLASGVFIVKLASTPFFLINFTVLAFFALDGTFLLPFGGVLYLLAVACGVVLTYFTMLSTSVYGWASVSQLRREQRITKAQAVVYSIVLCVFVADLVGGILLFATARRAKRATQIPNPAVVESGTGAVTG